VEYKTRGPQSLRPRVAVKAVLVTEPQFLNYLAVRLDIGPPQIVQQSATLAYHLQEAAAAVVIFAVLAEMIREIVDTLGQDRDLNLCRPSVRLVGTVLLNCGCFVESHFPEPLLLFLVDLSVAVELNHALRVVVGCTNAHPSGLGARDVDRGLRGRRGKNTRTQEDLGLSHWRDGLARHDAATKKKLQCPRF